MAAEGNIQLRYVDYKLCVEDFDVWNIRGTKFYEMSKFLLYRGQ